MGERKEAQLFSIDRTVRLLGMPIATITLLVLLEYHIHTNEIRLQV